MVSGRPRTYPHMRLPFMFYTIMAHKGASNGQSGGGCSKTSIGVQSDGTIYVHITSFPFAARLCTAKNTKMLTAKGKK